MTFCDNDMLLDDFFGYDEFDSSMDDIQQSYTNTRTEPVGFSEIKTNLENNKRTIICQILKTQYREKVGKNNTPMFKATLLDRSYKSQYNGYINQELKNGDNTYYDEINFFCWGDMASTYNIDFDIGNVFEISDFDIEEDKYKYPNSINHPFVIKNINISYFNPNHKTTYIINNDIKPYSNAEIISRIKMKYISIKTINNIDMNTVSSFDLYNIIGLVGWCGDLIPPSNDGKYNTRKMMIIDEYGYCINVLLVGSIAEKFVCIKGDIIALKDFHLSDTWGKSLCGFRDSCSGAILYTKSIDNSNERYNSDDNDEYLCDIEDDNKLSRKDEFTRNKCICDKNNENFSDLVKKLVSWSETCEDIELNLCFNISTKDLSTTGKIRKKDLFDIENEESTLLNENNPGPLLYTLDVKLKDLFSSNNCITIYKCSHKNCNYKVNYVHKLAKWICGNPNIINDTYTGDICKDIVDEFKLIGHVMDYPSIKFWAKINVMCIDSGIIKKINISDSICSKLLGGITAEKWITLSKSSQDIIINKYIKTQSSLIWKVHASSKFVKNKSTLKNDNKKYNKTYGNIYFNIISMEQSISTNAINFKSNDDNVISQLDNNEECKPPPNKKTKFIIDFEDDESTSNNDDNDIYTNNDLNYIYNYIHNTWQNLRYPQSKDIDPDSRFFSIIPFVISNNIKIHYNIDAKEQISPIWDSFYIYDNKQEQLLYECSYKPSYLKSIRSCSCGENNDNKCKKCSKNFRNYGMTIFKYKYEYIQDNGDNNNNNITKPTHCFSKIIIDKDKLMKELKINIDKIQKKINI